MELVLTREGQEILDRVVNMPYITLPFVRERLRRRYLRIISLIMIEQGVKEAGKELVMEAIRIVEGDRFNYMFRMKEDPSMYKRLIVAPNVDMEAYYGLPRQVKRWNLPKSKPTKRPDEMKVLAFNASPRVGGNTDVLIDEALRGAKDTGAAGVEKIMLREM